MTYEEEEEMQHDISKLRDQLQQISLSKKVTEARMNSLKKCMEAKMDGLEVNIEYFKKEMEGFKEGLAKSLRKMLHNGEKVVEETHDENKRNVSHDFIDSNVGLKAHHVPKVDMRKFDGKNYVTWILHMEKYLDIHNVKKYKNGMHCNFVCGTKSVCMVSMAFLS